MNFNIRSRWLEFQIVIKLSILTTSHTIHTNYTQYTIAHTHSTVYTHCTHIAHILHTIHTSYNILNIIQFRISFLPNKWSGIEIYSSSANSNSIPLPCIERTIITLFYVTTENMNVYIMVQKNLLAFILTHSVIRV